MIGAGGKGARQLYRGPTPISLLCLQFSPQLKDINALHARSPQGDGELLRQSLEWNSVDRKGNREGARKEVNVGKQKAKTEF